MAIFNSYFDITRGYSLIFKCFMAAFRLVTLRRSGLQIHLGVRTIPGGVGHVEIPKMSLEVKKKAFMIDVYL